MSSRRGRPYLGLCSHESGASKRKKKAAEKKQEAAEQGSLLKHFKLLPTSETNTETETNTDIESLSDSSDTTETDEQSIKSSQSPEVSEHEPPSADERNIINDDPAKWPEISDKIRLEIVKRGPHQIMQDDFPITSARKFTNENYYRKMENGEKILRSWLVYSATQDSVFCFCCKLFSQQTELKLVKEGFTGWQYLHKTLSSHERSLDHVNCLKKWYECETGLNTGMLIDRQEQRLLETEKQRWRSVLHRLLAIIQSLAERNLAFRGNSDKLFDANNGNFLAQVELLAKFDPVLSEHVRRVKDKEIYTNYLGHKVQNEFISLLAEKVLQTILERQMKAKYFSIILDCTPDVSHKEQMTVVIRFVEISGQTVEIREHFLGFLHVTNTTGAGLTESLLTILNKNKIDISDCRGQGYDNGSNMKGKNVGVQRRVLDMNNRAAYLPCGSHNLNLVVADAAKASVTAKSFFGYLQSLYAFFAASTARWEILKKYCPLSLKPLSDTRWECRISSVRVLRLYSKEIREALIEIRESSDDGKIYNEAQSLADEISSFRFLICLVSWYKLLSEINRVSKALQSADMQIDVAKKLITAISSFLDQFRENGFEKCTQDAKEIADALEIEPILPQQRLRKQKRMFDYEGVDQPIESAENRLKVEFFLKIVDTAKVSLQERFELLEKHAEHFEFLYNIFRLKNIDEETLLKHCKDLQSYLTSDKSSESDINAVDLCSDLKCLSNIISEEHSTALSVLKYLYEKKLNECFPTVAIILRILLTLPVTVATAERSFSKLKLIKNYLRSSMHQDRLSDLAILSIERETGKLIDYSDVIDRFASMKARKIDL